MMKYSFVFLMVLLSCLSNGQSLDIEINDNHEMRLNDSLFLHGELSLSRFQNIVNQNYVTRRGPRSSLRFFLYKFKKMGVTLKSNGISEPLDNCSEIMISLKENKNIHLKLQIYDSEINQNTTFDDIYYGSQLKNYIDRRYYPDEKNPNKSLLWVRIKYYTINFMFNAEGDSLEMVKIGTYWDDNIIKTTKT